MKKILLIIVVFSLFTGCIEKKTEYKIPTAETLTKGSTPGVTFASKKLSKSINNCSPGDSDCSYIRLNYVEATSGNGKDNINSLINKMMLATYEPDKNHSTPQQMIDLFIKNCGTSKKNIWMVDFNAREYSQTDKLHCLIFEHVIYFGAPPPKINTYFKNVYKETGDTATLIELLGRGFEDRLNSALEKIFREMRKLPPGDDLKEKGELFENKFKYTNNFALTKDKGMEFYYQSGEIMAGSWGPIVLKLTPEDVKGLIYGESPLK